MSHSLEKEEMVKKVVDSCLTKNLTVHFVI